MMLDGEGHVWIFSNAHGTARPAYIHRSASPYSVDEFELVATTNFSYAQPWHFAGRGFLLLHTRYVPARNLFWMTSADGWHWGEPHLLACVGRGHYQISCPAGKRVGTAFNYHPGPVGPNARTNLYYLETADFGASWRAASGQQVELPITQVRNPALVHDYESEGLLVYLKDIQFDRNGRPVILYVTRRGHMPGPAGGPAQWHTARWTGREWALLPVTTSDKGSPRNHTYVRRPFNAHPDFYAFWADGNPRQPSVSHLYFTNRAGDHVWRLPPRMKDKMAAPEPLW